MFMENSQTEVESGVEPTSVPPKKEGRRGFSSYFPLGRLRNFSGGSSWLGVILLAIGLFYLARQVGWISPNVSFWPIILILLGCHFLSTNLNK